MFSQAFITPGMLVEGNGPVRGGLVKMLSVDCEARTGAPTLTLYFVDEAIQPAEFSMDVKGACRLFLGLVNANKQVHWEWRKPKDYVASEKKLDVPLDVSITECGMMRDASMRLDMESGNAAFTIGLRRGKVGTLDFTLDPAVCLSLMKALLDLHDHFGWTRGARASRQLHEPYSSRRSPVVAAPPVCGATL